MSLKVYSSKMHARVGLLGNVSCNSVQPPLMLHHKSIHQFPVIPYPATWVVGVAWACPSCLGGEDRVTSLVNHRGYNYLHSHLWAVSCCQLAWSTCIWTVEVSQSILKIHTDRLITQKLSFIGKTGIEPLSPICKVTAKTQWPWAPGHYKPAASVSKWCLFRFKEQLFHLKRLNVV